MCGKRQLRLCFRPLPKSNSVFMWGSSAHEQKAARLAPRTRNVTRWPVTTCKLGKQTLCHQHLLWISHHLHASLPCMCRPLIGKSILAALALYLLNGSDGRYEPEYTVWFQPASLQRFVLYIKCVMDVKWFPFFHTDMLTSKASSFLSLLIFLSL